MDKITFSIVIAAAIIFASLVIVAVDKKIKTTGFSNYKLELRPIHLGYLFCIFGLANWSVFSTFLAILVLIGYNYLHVYMYVIPPSEKFKGGNFQIFSIRAVHSIRFAVVGFLIGKILSPLLDYWWLEYGKNCIVRGYC